MMFTSILRASSVRSNSATVSNKFLSAPAYHNAQIKSSFITRRKILAPVAKPIFYILSQVCIRSLCKWSKLQKTHYDTLKVSRGASFAEIKVAYFRLAKKLHPDKQVKNSGDVTEFLALVEAYDVLSDPCKRQTYDRKLEYSPYEFTGGVGVSTANDEPFESEDRTESKFSSSAYSGSKLDYGFDEPYIHGWKKTEIIEYQKGISMLEIIKMEFKEAMFMAYQGPRVPEFESMGMEKSIMFPWAFEAEIRNSEKHSDILQIVSGRQLLGFVRNSSYEVTEIEDEYHDIDDQGRNVTSLDLYYQERKVARAVKYNSSEGIVIKIYGTELNHPDGPMSLIGSILCVDGGDKVATAMKNLWELLPELRLRSGEPKKKDSFIGPSAGRVKCYEVRCAQKKVTHLLIQQKTLGVKHQYWFSNSKERFKCDVKGHMAWMPANKILSLWEPRSAHHSSGSWCFEVARPSVEDESLVEEVWEILNDKQDSVNAIPERVRLQWGM